MRSLVAVSAREAKASSASGERLAPRSRTPSATASGDAGAAAPASALPATVLSTPRRAAARRSRRRCAFTRPAFVRITRAAQASSSPHSSAISCAISRPISSAISAAWRPVNACSIGPRSAGPSASSPSTCSGWRGEGAWRAGAMSTVSNMVPTPPASASAAARPVMSCVPGVTSSASSASSSVASPVDRCRCARVRRSRYSARRDRGKQMTKYSSAATTYTGP